MGRLQLFDDGGDSPNGGEDDLSKIEINHEFAKRYEYNKKREELQKYEELKKQGRVDSESDESSSDEEEELIKPSKKTDLAFFDALIKVKNQDPVLKDTDAKLFNSDSEDDDGSDGAGEVKGKHEKKQKPMYLKDVVSKHLIEEGPEFDDEEMENGGNHGNANRVKSYKEEQDELRRQFLKAVEEEEGNIEEGGDFIRVKNSGMRDEEEEDDDDDEIGGKLDEYFGEDEKLDENTMFLKDFFRKKMWMDDKSSNARHEDVDISEDEEEVEKQEDYEREFNFRYEENAGDRVMGHSRKVEGSVRKKDNARKVQRERKEERMVQAEFERKEELKRLKNLKKKEINEKLQKIREVAGITGEGENAFLDEDHLEEEFDPEAYDKKMKAAFGDGYYDAKDVDPKFGSDDEEEDEGEIEKPDFDKEDELLGLEKGWDEAYESREGFISARQRILKDRVVSDENEVSEDGSKEGKRKRKRKPSEVEMALKEGMMEEYYKLDYEDTIGDLKTRFKYRPVKANRYGLTPDEILKADEKELNQCVPLKKMPPYGEQEWKVPRSKIIELKQKIKNVGKVGTSNSVNEDRKEKRDDALESNGETSAGLSRGSKRRRRQAELRLPVTRLMAYGKIPSKSKSKKKQ
ncbi:hypothetical protein ACP275_03G107800 [Erythranthe tilingii]